ncbi:MAG: hypothetical protein NW241_00880 [Bacteroidia bacterium]|nr:hypothetical protein [Bacteroidia bacterium]
MNAFKQLNLLRACLVLGCLLLAGPAAFSQSTIQNAWKKTFLTNSSGFPGLSAQDANSYWVLEPISGSPEVRIKHTRSGLYLHTETDAASPVLGPIQPGWWSAMWILEPVAGAADQFRIKNKYRGTYLHNETGTIQTGQIQPGWLSARWNILRERWSNDPSTMLASTITIANRAGYSAAVSISYILPAGQPDEQGTTSYEDRPFVMTKQIALYQDAYVKLPNAATSIEVVADGIACTDALDLKASFPNTASVGGNKCYKLWGTIFSTEWAAVDCSEVKDYRAEPVLDNFLMGEPKKTGLAGGYVSIFNQSGYVARISAVYTLPAGAADEAGQVSAQPRSVTKNETIALGSTWKMSIPSAAIGIVVSAEGVACIDPLNMTLTFGTAKDANQCYKLWGTVFSTEWGSISCN